MTSTLPIMRDSSERVDSVRTTGHDRGKPVTRRAHGLPYNGPARIEQTARVSQLCDVSTEVIEISVTVKTRKPDFANPRVVF